MYKQLIFFILLLLLPLAGKLQPQYEPHFSLPDSIANKLKETHVTDMARANALISTIEYFFEKERADLSYPHIKELRGLSYYTKGDGYQKALCDYYLGRYLAMGAENDSALILLNKALLRLEGLKKSKKNELLQLRICVTKSGALYIASLFADQYECIMKGLEIAERIDDAKNKQKLYNNLGVLYKSIDKNKEAIAAFKNASSENASSFYYLNIANTYGEMGIMDSANIYFDTAWMYARNICDSVYVLNSLGRNIVSAGDWQKGKDCQLRAMKWIEHRDICGKSAKSFIAYDIATAENNLGDYRSALKHIKEAIETAKENQDMPLVCNSLKMKSEIENKLKNYEVALNDLIEYQYITDSLVKLKDVSRIYQFEKEIEFRKIEEQFKYDSFVLKQKHKNTIILAVGVATFLFLAGLLFILYSRNKRKMLEIQLNAQYREITSKTMEQMQLNEVLSQAVDKLSHISNNQNDGESNVISTVSDLKSLINDNSKKDFDYYFVQVHPDFYNKLLKDYPTLTQNELRLCAFIKANLNTKDIATLNNMSADSVKNARSKLRKKLGMKDPNEALSEFIAKY